MNYKEILQELGVPLIWAPIELEARAWYLPQAFEYSERGAIFVRLEMSELETEAAILHEIGHIIEGSLIGSLSPQQLHLLNEAKADRYMIKNLLKKFIEALDGAIEFFRVEKFLEWAGLSNKYYDVAMQEAWEIIHTSN